MGNEKYDVWMQFLPINALLLLYLCFFKNVWFLMQKSDFLTLFFWFWKMLIRPLLLSHFPIFTLSIIYQLLLPRHSLPSFSAHVISLLSFSKLTHTPLFTPTCQQNCSIPSDLCNFLRHFVIPIQFVISTPFTLFASQHFPSTFSTICLLTIQTKLHAPNI